jgi:glucans biosynthesis protein C
VSADTNAMDPRPLEPHRRYHALDALRAAMMLLGLVLHAAISYIETPMPSLWPYSDPQRSLAFDLTVFFIHVFRMPVFFVVAGFFAAFVYHRDGAARFAATAAAASCCRWRSSGSWSTR